MYRDFLDIVGGKSDATVKVECNFYDRDMQCITGPNGYNKQYEMAV